MLQDQQRKKEKGEVLSSDIEFYLDSNIIIAYHFPKDENNQYKRILRCLKKISLRNDISLIASSWTLAETRIGIIKKTREMLDKKKITGKRADYLFDEAMRTIENLEKFPKLGDVNFKIRKIKRNITAEGLLKMVYRISSLGNITDALHCAIMNVLGIRYILTFNDKDFRIFEEHIPNIEAVNPDNINNYIGKTPAEPEEREYNDECLQAHY